MASLQCTAFYPPARPFTLHRVMRGTGLRCSSDATTLDDRELLVKVSLAQNTGKLDLTELKLTAMPGAALGIPGLEELSLAGNQLTHLPDAIGQLTDLKMLGLAGNQLPTLPGSLTHLCQLKGLWAHGNLLVALPPLGGLVELRQLSLSGNVLTRLPEDISSLTHLEQLSVGGNRLTELPSGLGALEGLKKLQAHGNELSSMPGSLLTLTALEDLALQGNRFSQWPCHLSGLHQLGELSLADNRLEKVDEGVGLMTSLKKLSLYGNCLEDLPVAALASLPNLESLWLEGNPLRPPVVEELLLALPTMTSLRSLGLDYQQVQNVSCDLLSRSAPVLKLSHLEGEGPGYFKLCCGAPGLPADQRVLVVAFGSAPGELNWGGLLSRVSRAAVDEVEGSFDVLYVVDPHRSWYGGGDNEVWEYYRQRLQRYTSEYHHVVMLGDSMGASAALMFAPLASQVLAFCPQVDLTLASIRPGQPTSWLIQLRDRIMSSVVGAAQQGTSIQVLSGTWQHDLQQVGLLPPNAIQQKVFSLDSHRLALYLDRQGKLLPLVRENILTCMGRNSGNLRLVNFV